MSPLACSSGHLRTRRFGQTGHLSRRRQSQREGLRSIEYVVPKLGRERRELGRDLVESRLGLAFEPDAAQLGASDLKLGHPPLRLGERRPRGGVRTQGEPPSAHREAGVGKRADS